MRHPSLEGRGSRYSPTQHELHVARTFAVSWERLDKNDPIDDLAQQLFLHAAYFAPGVPIPPDLWHLTLAEQDTEPPTLTEYDYEDAQYRLVELGLLEKEATGFTIHRLVAAFARIQPQHHDARQQVEQALLNEAERLNNAGYPAPLQAWQTHLHHLTDATQQREDELAASLCNTMGVHLYTVADYKKARPYYERALAIREKVLGEQHPDTATSTGNLGVLWQAQGEYESTRPYLERALAIHEKVLGTTHANTALSLNNLGALLQAQGHTARESARLYYKRALAICEKRLGANHPDTANSLNNLGGLLDSQGHTARENARPYYERALAIREKVLGEEHLDTAASLNNLGTLFYAQGHTARESAHSYYERALAIYEKVLGSEHPDTATSTGNLGSLLDSQGHTARESARPYYERALAICEKRLGATHSLTQTVRRNLQRLERG